MAWSGWAAAARARISNDVVELKERGGQIRLQIAVMGGIRKQTTVNTRFDMERMFMFTPGGGEAATRAGIGTLRARPRPSAPGSADRVDGRAARKVPRVCVGVQVGRVRGDVGAEQTPALDMAGRVATSNSSPCYDLPSPSSEAVAFLLVPRLLVPLGLSEERRALRPRLRLRVGGRRAGLAPGPQHIFESAAYETQAHGYTYLPRGQYW